MPTSVRITKDMILETAFQIAREKGQDGISNREIAKKMNCSIRPIYYQFKNVEELTKELYRKIENYFYEFLLNSITDEKTAYRQTGINYIKFAKEEKNLFKILFMNESKDIPSDFIFDDSDGFNNLKKIIKDTTNLNENDIESFHTKMWFFTHGIATLVASDTIELDDNQIQKLLISEFQALMLLEENPNNKWVIKNDL